MISNAKKSNPYHTKKPNLLLFTLKNLFKEKFNCPICNYKGPFLDKDLPDGFCKHMKCPNCLCAVRHRIQYLVFMNIFKDVDTAKLKMLHIAPEAFFRKIFSKMFGEYETADLHMKNVDHKVDLTNLPFVDSSYDFIMASDVLEHIDDDKSAIKEISRILRPNGIAILHVPVMCEKTIEYPEPSLHEAGHVRAPGMDYFERYKPYFSKVELIASESLPYKYQLFNYNDRSIFPNEISPFRTPMFGDKHTDIVPVCYK
jgi:SAM-dependent methyltransferase